MMQIFFAPRFVRQFKKLSPELQADVEKAIELFRASSRDQSLNLHKLQGKLKGFFSFTVNYRYRIVCEQDGENVWALLAVGDHDVYR